MTPYDRAKKGGTARAAKLTPAERSAIARHAVQSRWAKYRRHAQTETVSDVQWMTVWCQCS